MTDGAPAATLLVLLLVTVVGHGLLIAFAEKFLHLFARLVGIVDKPDPSLTEAGRIVLALIKVKLIVPLPFFLALIPIIAIYPRDWRMVFAAFVALLAFVLSLWIALNRKMIADKLAALPVTPSSGSGQQAGNQDMIGN